MRKKTIIILSIISIVIISAIITIKIIYSDIEQNLNYLKSIKIEDVDLTKIPDGKYTGSYETFPVAATVEVTVKDHVITAIDIIKHDNGQGKAAEYIIYDVIKTGSLQVDAISGATYSSKVILKAIENALLK
ncbi:MAG: FMN-binding protein [Eubacteriales bacterium]